MRDLVFIEGGGKINDETKEKLGFLTTTCNSFTGHDEAGGGQNKGSRLDTINEAMNSTGKWWNQSVNPFCMFFWYAFEPANLNFQLYNVFEF